MNRRHFLQHLAVWTGLGAAAPSVPALASVEAAPPPVPREIELQQSAVAGFQYHQGETVWELLMVGDALELVREPGNTHDPRAVRVEWNGRKLGYVPRTDNAALCHLLDQGRGVRAEIIAMRESANPWHRLRFAAYLLP